MSIQLSAGDLCTRSTAVAPRSLRIADAARRMREHQVGCLVVTEDKPEGRVPVGLLTDRDIVMAVLAHQLEPGTFCVEDVMSESLVTANEADSVLEVLASMGRAGVRRVPVVNGLGVLQGLLSFDDVLEIVGEEMQALVKVLGNARRHEARRRPPDLLGR